MKKISETIIFFGSGPVAAASLELLAGSFAIEAVITKPRAPHHRGDVPVLTTANKLGLPIHTVTDKQTLQQLFTSHQFNSHCAILIDFGIIVPQIVIDSFPRGIVNSHFSLLPEWRGADPITFSILSGQKHTGVSLMLLVAGLDEGPLLAQSSVDIPPRATTASLTDTLVQLSYRMLVQTTPTYLAGSVEPYPQPPTTPTYSRKISKEDGIIDWNKAALHIEREIRAFQHWPKTHTVLAGVDVIITQAHVIDAHGVPGTVSVVDGCLAVYCAKQALVLDLVKPASKKEMTGQAFLAGYKKRLFTT